MKTLKIALMAFAMTAALAGCKTGKAPAPQPTAPPSMNFSLKTNDRSDLIRVYSTIGASEKAGKVRVCIRNSASGRDKGLHFKAASGPKYVVRTKNQMSCGHYSPGPKTFYLWRNTPLGKMKERAVRNLDLTGFAGQQITFDWVRD